VTTVLGLVVTAAGVLAIGVGGWAVVGTSKKKSGECGGILEAHAHLGTRLVRMRSPCHR
jgi:hypothetical protein